jgi:hypothetical protein
MANLSHTKETALSWHRALSLPLRTRAETEKPSWLQKESDFLVRSTGSRMAWPSARGGTLSRYAAFLSLICGLGAATVESAMTLFMMKWFKKSKRMDMIK